MFAMMAYNSPRIFATGYDSFVTQYHRVSQEFGAGSTFAGSFGIVQMLILLLPALGIIVTFSRTGLRLGRGVWTKTEGNPPARLACVMGLGVASAFLAYTWLPNHGDYRAIQRGDRGVLGGAIRELGSVPGRLPRLQVTHIPATTTTNGTTAQTTTGATSTSQSSTTRSSGTATTRGATTPSFTATTDTATLPTDTTAPTDTTTAPTDTTTVP